MSDDPGPTQLSDEECLKVRKWWCFLLSSIFTFLAGIFIVLIWRAFSFLCCRNRDPSEYEKQQEKDKLLAQQGQPPGQPKPKNLMEGNFVTEAKDWAGELISGQTTTGRILVSIFLFFVFHFWGNMEGGRRHIVDSCHVAWLIGSMALPLYLTLVKTCLHTKGSNYCIMCQ